MILFALISDVNSIAADKRETLIFTPITFVATLMAIRVALGERSLELRIISGQLSSTRQLRHQFVHGLRLQPQFILLEQAHEALAVIGAQVMMIGLAVVAVAQLT